jgi:hypothetical protein
LATQSGSKKAAVKSGSTRAPVGGGGLSLNLIVSVVLGFLYSAVVLLAEWAVGELAVLLWGAGKVPYPVEAALTCVTWISCAVFVLVAALDAIKTMKLAVRELKA